MESVEDNSILCALPDRVTPDSQISSSPNRSRSGAQSREQEGDVVTLEGFWGLPVEIKVIILQSIQEKWELLTILCRANKSFNELVTPILYANIDLQASRPYRPWRRRGRVLGNDKFQRQEAYLMSVRKHPEYLANARHLGWESIESGWAIFPGMTNIRSIDLSKGGETDPKTIVPVFPNLRSARLSGSFYLGSLECILLTSPYLAELHLNGVGEVQGDIKDRRTQVPTLIPFLDLCSSTYVEGSMDRHIW
ncbi:hypothetical protein FRC03_010949 [Tulasnella sp. 419]|nr:hypothetical protein FRC03_010949 [Tulasnella sp. 419]